VKIYICADFSRDAIETLKVAGHDVRTGGWGFGANVLEEDELIREIGDAQVLVVGYEKVSRKVIDATELKIISSIRGGPKANIDVDYCTQKGIPVFFTFGREAIPVSDFTIGQMLNITRKIARTDRELRGGLFTSPAGDFGSDSDVIWDINAEGPWQSRKGIELEGKTMGLIGFGTVGQQVAKRAQGFGINVITYDPFQREEIIQEFNATRVELDELLKSAHIISCHAKVTEANMGMIGKREFEMMRDGVYFINNARAGMVQEEAMREALRSGKLAGLALDVFHTEPIQQDDEYFTYDNVILTPHIAGSGRDVIYLQSVMITNDLLLYMAGGIPRPVANPEVFKK
jgi:D-3-phosphoglycerate dehydrogenase / 2-oxoglutarate reductase